MQWRQCARRQFHVRFSGVLRRVVLFLVHDACQTTRQQSTRDFINKIQTFDTFTYSHFYSNFRDLTYTCLLNKVSDVAN